MTMAVKKNVKKKPSRTVTGLKRDVSNIARDLRSDEFFDDSFGPDEIILYMGHKQNVLLQRIELRLKSIEKLLDKKRR